MAILIFLVVLFAAFVTWIYVSERLRTRGMTPEERDAYVQELQAKAERHKRALERSKVRNKERHGSVSLNLAKGARNPKIVCPQCQGAGKVHTKVGNHRAGISGGKAAAGLMTGGASLIVTGVSRREKRTSAYCDNCKSEWMF